MLRLELPVGVFVSETPINHAVRPAGLVIELRIFADLGAVVVRLLVYAPLVVLSFVGIINRDDFNSLAAEAVLIDDRVAAVDDKLYLQKKQSNRDLALNKSIIIRSTEITVFGMFDCQIFSETVLIKQFFPVPIRIAKTRSLLT